MYQEVKKLTCCCTFISWVVKLTFNLIIKLKGVFISFYY
jgi:hypothetical protein